MQMAIITNYAQRLAIGLITMGGLLLLCLPVAAVQSPAPIRPIPPVQGLDAEKVALGKILFHDKALSANQLSCASCHQLDKGGDSGRKTDTSHGDAAYAINTPSIFNVRFNFRQNWDGSSQSLRHSLRQIFDNHPPFDSDLKAAVDRLRRNKPLKNRFLRVYKQGLTQDSLLDSLETYLDSLVTPNARFDRYLAGDLTALTAEEREGWRLFRELGCVACHQGVNIGGNLFQKFGVFYDYIAQRGNPGVADFGRINVTGRKMDKYVFKVPSLRNVALTAPYLHDGSAETLEEAIIIVGVTQLGRNLSYHDVIRLKQFLLTLTGEYNGHLLTEEKND